jgi:hypothetical protein
MHPFGTPVVPDVYKTMAGASCEVGAHSRKAPHGSGIQPFDLGPQILFANENDRIGALDDRADLTLPQKRRRRHGHSADSKNRKKRRNELRPVHQAKDGAIALFDTSLPKRARNLHHLVGELAISNDGICGMDRNRRPAA